MRWIVPFALTMLAACSIAAMPSVVAQTPASISYECLSAVGGCQATPQQVADMAQTHCQKAGKNAQQASLARAPSGNLRASFNCI